MKLLRKVAKLKRNNPTQYRMICAIGDTVILGFLAMQFVIVGFLGNKAGLWDMSSVLVFGAAALLSLYRN